MNKSDFSEDFVALFWSKVRVASDDECWIWNGHQHINPRGKKTYGKIYYQRRNLAAHRVSYVLAGGIIPDGYFVCHACDVPECVNPKHLWTGTLQDNNADRHRKGRTVFAGIDRKFLGTDHGRSKLKDDDVRHIFTSTETTRALSRKYNVSPRAVNQIRNHGAWSHITNGLRRADA